MGADLSHLCIYEFNMSRSECVLRRISYSMGSGMTQEKLMEAVENDEGTSLKWRWSEKDDIVRIIYIPGNNAEPIVKPFSVLIRKGKQEIVELNVRYTECKLDHSDKHPLHISGLTFDWENKEYTIADFSILIVIEKEEDKMDASETEKLNVLCREQGFKGCIITSKTLTMGSKLPNDNLHQVLLEKRDLLYQMHLLHLEGVNPSKHFNMTDDIDEIRFEYAKLKHEVKKMGKIQDD